MPTERHIQDTVARCVATMARYHRADRSSEAQEQMIAEIEMLAGWALEMSLVPDDIETMLWQPVREELTARFGHEVGPRLNVAFLQAFESPHYIPGPGDTARGPWVDQCGLAWPGRPLAGSGMLSRAKGDTVFVTWRQPPSGGVLPP
jgi:hypothetical protein